MALSFTINYGLCHLLQWCWQEEWKQIFHSVIYFHNATSYIAKPFYFLYTQTHTQATRDQLKLCDWENKKKGTMSGPLERWVTRQRHRRERGNMAERTRTLSCRGGKKSLLLISQCNKTICLSAKKEFVDIVVQNATLFPTVPLVGRAVQ